MSVAACADLVRQADPDRFVTGQTATPAAQAKLWPIYALNIEIDGYFLGADLMPTCG